MKIKPIVIAASLLGSCIGLKAGILPRWVRALNSYEYNVLSDPMVVQRKLCYIEVRQVCSSYPTAQDYSDAILQEFLPDGNFNTFRGKDISRLLTEVVSHINNLRVADYIVLWLIRKMIDDGCDIYSTYAGDMQDNMWYFWECCPMLLKTIKAAEEVRMNIAEAQRPDQLTSDCFEEIPTPEGHERDYLDYPECFAALLTE